MIKQKPVLDTQKTRRNQSLHYRNHQITKEESKGAIK